MAAPPSATAAQTPPATLAQVCEPFFQYACRLNRSARKGLAPPFEMAAVRSEAEALFESMRRDAAAAGAQVKGAYDKVEIVLVYFFDWLIRSSALPFASAWSDLALARGKPGGDEDFFDELDKTLKDPAPDAPERLGVFYTCLGLGFTGWYAGQPDFLRKKMQEIHARIRAAVDSNPAQRITPEAYEHVNTADLVEPPATRLVGLVLVLAGLAATILAANAALFMERRGELRRTLDGITSLAGGSGGGGATSASSSGGAK